MPRIWANRPLTTWFQFLGRNSGRSDLPQVARPPKGLGVSIPRSEFWSFGPRPRPQHPRRRVSFNSSVGILVVRTLMLLCGLEGNHGFNSSVGILVVRTLYSMMLALPCSQFQFLGRNSGRSDGAAWDRGVHAWFKFQFLGRNSGRSDMMYLRKARTIKLVSIPRSEFWSFGRATRISTHS